MRRERPPSGASDYSHGLSRVSARVHARYDLADTVTIVASKRTGSTWVQELMSGGAGVCPIFEPLEGDPRGPRAVAGAPRTSSRPATPVPDLEAFLARAMRGAHVTRWSMRLASHRQLLAADRFVVKHVQLCRAAGWLAATFPDTPMVLVVRHPCAVVQSMLTVRVVRLERGRDPGQATRGGHAGWRSRSSTAASPRPRCSPPCGHRRCWPCWARPIRRGPR